MHDDELNDRDLKELCNAWRKYYEEINRKFLKPLDCFPVYLKYFGMNYRGLPESKYKRAKKIVEKERRG